MRFDLTRLRGVCAAAAIASVSSTALALFALTSLRAEYGAYNASVRESSALRSAAEAREAALARSKNFLSDETSLPPRAETANKFYAALLEALSSCALSEVKVSSVGERDGASSFVVTGLADYERLGGFLLSLRKFPFLTRLSKLSINGASGGELEFSVEVSAALAEAEGSAK